MKNIMELELKHLDRGNLMQCLILKLKNAINQLQPENDEDAESKAKLGAIELELEEVAQGVRNNLQSIFQRCEKFDSLVQKSDQLKSISSGLKKKATKIR